MKHTISYFFSDFHETLMLVQSETHSQSDFCLRSKDAKQCLLYKQILLFGIFHFKNMLSDTWNYYVTVS